MFEDPYPPEFRKPAFNCPHCKAFAKQEWYFCEGKRDNLTVEIIFKGQPLSVSICAVCNSPTFWQLFRKMDDTIRHRILDGKIIYPDTRTVPLPNDDLDGEIKKIYDEAASIVNRSPRAACALLRLALQMLLKQHGEKGDNINDDTKSLVKQNRLAPRILKALDIVRVTGNHAVHPGQIDFDDKNNALKLF